MTLFIRHSMRRCAIGALVLGATAVGCHAGADSDEGGASAAMVVNAGTLVVTAQAFTEYVSAIGTVAPRAGHMATLSAPAPARVASVLVTAGQPVSRG